MRSNTDHESAGGPGGNGKRGSNNCFSNNLKYDPSVINNCSYRTFNKSCTASYRVGS